MHWFAEHTFNAIFLVLGPDLRVIHSCDSIDFNIFSCFLPSCTLNDIQDHLRHLKAVHSRHINVSQNKPIGLNIRGKSLIYLLNTLLATVGSVNLFVKKLLYQELDRVNIECVIIYDKDIRWGSQGSINLKLLLSVVELALNLLGDRI